MKKAPAPISFAGSKLDRMRHVCAFFNSMDEEYRVLLPFIKDGLDGGDKAVHVVDPARHDQHLHCLASAGIDTADAQSKGQLEIHTSTATYLRDGRFDQDRMLEAFERMASGSSANPYPLSRIICQMEWASEHHDCIDDLVEFEARINDVWQRHDDAVICVYDLAKFSGDTVIDIMRTHPMVIIGGILQQNPFFVPPQEFLHELRRRRQGRVPPSGSAG
jgi:hypothetical protein